MTAAIKFGQIIWAEVADSKGFRKLRPAVVVTPTDRISPSGPVEVVAITSQVPQPLPSDHVLLPWHPRGHPRTGLNRKCAAVCTWVARIAPADIQNIGGIVPGPVLHEIVSRTVSPSSTPPSPPPEVKAPEKAEPSGESPKSNNGPS